MPPHDVIHLYQDADSRKTVCGAAPTRASGPGGHRVEQCQTCAQIARAYAGLDGLIAAHFTPYLETVPGTASRRARLQTLHDHLLKDVVAAGGIDQALAQRNPAGIDPIGSMREVLADQLAALRRYGIWDPRKTPWCRDHWEPIRRGVMAETHSGILATAALVEQFVMYLMEQGLLPEKLSVEEMTKLKVAHSPICCAIGFERLTAVYTAAQNPNVEAPRDV